MKLQSQGRMIEGLDKDDIERLAEKKDKILQMMDDLAEAEEEEKESQVRQTIGFIGELIYSHYLENKKLVKDKDFIHAALRRCWWIWFWNQTREDVCWRKDNTL